MKNNRSRSAKKTILIVVLVLLVIGALLQFYRPALDNPPVTADLSAPPEVKSILQRACYDCHSNQTRLAWFDQPAPAYWLVVKDVEAGRKVLNFSNFDSLTPVQKAGKLYECLNQIEFHSMPLSSYALLHRGADISAGEIAVLRQYLLRLAPKAVPDSAKQRLALAQFARWRGVEAEAPKNAPNGISYHQGLAGFAGWKAVSTTERYDNGTLRVILGNDIAAQAIREGHTDPWPKGATFAKVAWDQLPDSSGVIRTGAFKQVEFMIRDEDKYTHTDGWGFARWVGGLEMKPYGKNAGFVTECVGCHQPMADHDHVFTLPLADTLALYDQAALLPDSLGGRPLDGRVITSFVRQRDRAMSTLYGNETAARQARSRQPGYPAGAVLELVTWSQRDDPHWFGGRIPDAVESVEVVRFGAGGAPSYTDYEGMPLAKKTRPAMEVQDRIAYITGWKAAVFP